MILVKPYIYIGFSKKIVSYYLIDLCHILIVFNSKPIKFINLLSFLIYWVLIYTVSIALYRIYHGQALNEIEIFILIYKITQNIRIIKSTLQLLGYIVFWFFTKTLRQLGWKFNLIWLNVNIKILMICQEVVLEILDLHFRI